MLNRICKSSLRSLIITSVMLLPATLWATHQRAAEITYRHIADLTYEIVLISYTYTPSPANDYRDYLMINWGDGTSSEIPRIERTNLGNDITFNKYKGQHIFPGPSSYIISCEDPNRNGGILNIPNSINIPLFIFSELVINPFLEGYNNSPVLLLPPIDNACVNQPYYHNPGAYDPDGDSLSYRLVTCLGAQGAPIPGYTLPPASSSVSIDSISGDFLWDTPMQQGEFNIAILIEEWREGVKIGSVLRDMQIIVIACDNRPPEIQTVADTCVEAGSWLLFPVTATDPDGDVIVLTATGGPFVVPENNANLDPSPAVDTGSVTALFTWNTICEHVRRSPYQVYFKARDNSEPVNLVNILTMNILVVGPAPENLTATPLGKSITLEWDNYACQNAAGYAIFRKPDSTGFVHDYCETGVPAYLGYTRIAEISGIETTSFTDNGIGGGLKLGVKYCYMVVAVYPDRAEGYASNEACATLKRDIPILTNASVRVTSETNGSMFVAWSKPTEIDTLQAPGPYETLLFRAPADNPQNPVLILTTQDLNDTLFIDTLLNSTETRYLYVIDFYNNTPGNRFLIGTSEPASSVYLTLSPTDETVILSWLYEVPWTNHSVVIYRQDPGNTAFDSIGFTTDTTYSDRGLINGETYCYKIKTVGRYSAPGFIDPILNFSQESCAVPIDNLPPCTPELAVTTNCEQQNNLLSWHFTSDSCALDLARVIIFYSQSSEGTLMRIDSVMKQSDTSYLHVPPGSVVGCYAIAAVDSVGNISDTSNIVCIDYDDCDLYRLPNVFTPNDDKKNDLFHPFPYSSVSSVHIYIYDRWGKLVYETTDPDINWNGDDMTTNQPCSDGVYFYVCDVELITLRGIVPKVLKGSVTILR